MFSMGECEVFSIRLNQRKSRRETPKMDKVDLTAQSLALVDTSKTPSHPKNRQHPSANTITGGALEPLQR